MLTGMPWGFELGGPSLQSPSPADVHAAAFCPHRAPLSICGGCGVEPFPSCQALPWGWKGQQPKHTQVGCVWSDATRLASCHLFLGLLNTRQVKHPCLEDAAFLETTGKLERGGAVGFPAQEPEVPSDQKPGTNSTCSALCSMLARLFCLIQYKPLLFCVYVSQHNICPDTKYTNTFLVSHKPYPVLCKSPITLCISDC